MVIQHGAGVGVVDTEVVKLKLDRLCQATAALGQQVTVLVINTGVHEMLVFEKAVTGLCASEGGGEK